VNRLRIRVGAYLQVKSDVADRRILGGDNGVADLPSRKLPGLLAGLNGRKINALL
jgi:hypothetical protein